MNYDDVKLFEKIRYSKVVFSKIVLSIIIAFFPILDTYLFKVEIAFLAYLGLSLSTLVLLFQETISLQYF